MMEVNPNRPAYLIMNESGNYEYLKRLSLILKNETKQRNRIVWTEHHMKRKGENFYQCI
ncbi:hypothetical protein C8D70_10587 [Chryseobacterium sp. CBTAP 102]|nr:hypothetical protein C8D70_10587 [Chryseobacterium sp. CBTAP 102]